MPIDLSQVGHFDVRTEEGLTAAQVADRVENGLDNIDTSKKSKTIPQIIFSNIFTFFNVIYIVIAAILLFYGMPKQCSFLPVVAANTLIAIVQEIKSKRTLDRLNLITEPKIRVVRDGVTTEISVKELVRRLCGSQRIHIDGRKRSRHQARGRHLVRRQFCCQRQLHGAGVGCRAVQLHCRAYGSCAYVSKAAFPNAEIT